MPRLSGWPIVGALALAIAVAGFRFFYPEPPPLRPAIAGDMQPIDARSGVYVDDADARWLVAPALSGGFRIYPLDLWGATSRVEESMLDAELALRRLTRAEQQPYELHARKVHSSVGLEGWTIAPASPKAAIVILHGSGNSDRSNGWYVLLAHMLAAEGFAVALPDKRGSGRSEGDWRAEALTALAEDGAAWAAAIREDFPDAARIGFLGVSQGGMIAPTAAKLFGADFAVGVSVTATSLNEQLLHEVGNDVRAAGAPNLLIPAIRAIYTQRAKNRYGEFWRKNGSFDTLSEWSKWGGPFFIILGADDERQFNPVEKSVARLAATDTKGGRLIWRVYQGVNHSLTYGPGPDEDRFHRDFVRDLFDWLDNYEIVGETR